MATTSNVQTVYGAMLLTGCDRCGAEFAQPLTADTHDLHLCEPCAEYPCGHRRHTAEASDDCPTCARLAALPGSDW